MKKCYYFLMVMLLTLVSVGFVSCGDDDEPKSSDIVGTWAFDNTDLIGAGVTLFQFTKDGKFYEVDKSMVLGDDEVVYHGTYTITGDKLTITYIFLSETETIDCTYQVKGNKLTITNGGHSSTFIRVEDSVIEPYLLSIIDY